MNSVIKTIALAAGALAFVAPDLALGAPNAATRRESEIPNETYGPVKIVAPKAEIAAFVILLSDGDGDTRHLQPQADALVEAGAAVAVLSVPQLVAGLAKGDETECHYVLGDFEDISQGGQRALGNANYHMPIIVGEGEGGTIAYLALAQSPANTAGGAISIGLPTTIKSKLPFCEGAPSTPAGAGAFAYKPAAELPAPWLLISKDEPDAALAAFVGKLKGASLRVVPGTAEDRWKAARQAALVMAPPVAEGGLPLVELPTKGQARALAVFYSGDGGWRDIDKTIAEFLSEHGVAVVGVDMLRYAWHRRSPEQMGSDLDRIVTSYRARWKVDDTAVLGYSFGAGVVPFAYNASRPRTRQFVDLIALMGLEPAASFEISVAGFLGVSSSDDVDIRPALAKLPLDKVMCFYGADEDPADTACTLPELKGATLIKRPGGHHFDGEYIPIAEAILNRLIPK